MSKEENRVIKFWRGDSKLYYWILFSGNGDPLCEGIHGYSVKNSAKVAAKSLFPEAQVELKLIQP